MWFRVIGEIRNIKTIAVGASIREVARLRKVYGKGRWRKMKGFAMIELPNGDISTAEIHWYQAHGIGAKEFKVKRLLEG